jgi:outer membrane protein TolC
MSRDRKFAGLLLLPVLLAGCSSQFTNGALSDVSTLTAARIAAPAQWQRSEEARAAAREQRDRLLAAPLSPDTAVVVAMLNNRALQADLAELGIAGAERAAVSRPPNPSISFARLTRGSELEIERSVSANVLGLLAWPFARTIEERRFAQAKFTAAGNVLRVAADGRRAFYRAVAAQQTAQFIGRVHQAAEAQAELGRRMYEVGNWSLLDYGREQVLYAEVTVLLAKSRLQAERERSNLARHLGLNPGDKFLLPERLPDLPATLADGGELEAGALAERLDLRAGRAEVEGVGKSLGLTRTTRFINVAEASYLRNSETGQPRQTGYEISLEIPLFDFGDARVARAEAIYMQAVDRLAAMAAGARADVHESWLSYRTAYDIAVHYRDNVLPVRQRLSDEMVYRYNGMLVSVFDLLRDARERMAASVAAIEAHRDFLLAETDLQFVTLIGTAPADLPRIALPAAEGGGH